MKTMSPPIPVVLFGLGPIGQRIGQMAAERPELKLVGGVDLHPERVGRGLGELLGIPSLQAPIVPELAALPRVEGSGVVLHATGSSLEAVAPQLEAILAQGYDLISTCEELSYPYFHQQALAERLDAAARSHDVTLLGTGVNPGYAMDLLPLALTATAKSVEHVRVERRVAAGERREPLQRKVGAGLTKEAFLRGVASKTIRHVGLPESAAAVAAALGWKVDAIDETIEPVLADSRITTQYLTVEPGQVAGVHQVARASQNGKERVLLDLVMSVSVPKSEDRVQLTGEPSMSMTLQGIHGDIATAAVALNSIASVRAARAGLLTMADLALVHR